MGSPNLLREKVQEELKAAGICFFRAANLAGRFYYHSVHGDSVRRRCNRYSPTTTQAGEVPAKFGEAEPLRWYQSILLAPVVLLVLYALYLGLTGAVDTYQCYKAGGLYNWTEGKCG